MSYKRKLKYMEYDDYPKKDGDKTYYVWKPVEVKTIKGTFWIASMVLLPVGYSIPINTNAAHLYAVKEICQWLCSQKTKDGYSPEQADEIIQLSLKNSDGVDLLIKTS